MTTEEIDTICEQLCLRAAKHIFRELCNGNKWPAGMTILDGIKALQSEGYSTLGDNHSLVEKLMNGNDKCKGPLVGKLLSISPAIHPVLAEVFLDDWIQLLNGSPENAHDFRRGMNQGEQS